MRAAWQSVATLGAGADSVRESIYPLPVHMRMLVEPGVYILEMVYLEETPRRAGFTSSASSVCP